MEEDRVELRTEEQVVNQITEAYARHFGVPVPDRFLDTEVVAELNEFNTDLPISIAARDVALGNETTYLALTKNAHLPLFKRCSAFYNELAGHVDCGDVPVGALSFFGLDSKGNHLSMITDADLLSASDKIRLGNLAMIAAGYAPNIGFTAASILALRTPFKVIVDEKDNKKQTAANAEIATAAMVKLAKATGDEVFAQSKIHTRKMEVGAAREFMRTYGIHFEAPKVKTIIGGEVFLPTAEHANGAEVRIGPIETKKGRASQEGVVGHTNAKGHFEVITVIEGDTFVNVRMLNCKDAHIPITIVAGTNQTALTIALVAGTSSL
ncbi:MAG: hypothetical protein WCL14_02830 [Bacteroidota bacterium]